MPSLAPISPIGPVERTWKTEKVRFAYDPDSLRLVVQAKSVATGRTRQLDSLAWLAEEDLDTAQAWVLRCGSALVM